MAKKKAAPQEKAFLDEIVAHPADDAPRLVFADWLEEHNQERRAEFIRLQCRLAQMSEDDPQRIDLEEREWELHTVYRDEWLAPLPAWVRQAEPVFRRGFVEAVSITASTFLKKDDALFSCVPVRELRLSSPGGKLSSVLASPHVRQLTGLALSKPSVTLPDLLALASTSNLPNLTSLALPGAPVTAAALALARWPRFAHIARLDLEETDLTTDGFDALLSSGNLGALTWLNLRETKPSVGNMRALADAAPRLTHLTLPGLMDTMAEQIRALAASGQLPELRSLSLKYGRPDVPAALGESPLLAQLSKLHLEVVRGGGVVRELTQGDRLSRLRRLELSNCEILPDGAEMLASSPSLAGLRELILTANAIGDIGVQALVQSPYLRNLNVLDLGNAQISDGGGKLLATWPNSQLRELALWGYGTTVGAAGVIALAASPHLANLRKLSLCAYGVNDAAMRALATSSHMGNLRRLFLGGNLHASKETLRELANSPHLPKLIVLNAESWQDTPDELRQLGRQVSI